MLQELESLNLPVVAWEQLSLAQQHLLQAAISAESQPQAIVYPATQFALADVMSLAYRNHWRVLVIGQGSKVGWGGLVEQPDLIISTCYLNRLIEHCAGDLTVTAEAGMTLQTLQQILAQAGQFLPIDPHYAQTATLGGILNTADTGSLRQRYGGVRDLVLGITLIRADGKIAKAGGRVVKNVAGYDLMKLLTGSYGTLGIVSQITFRLYPLPPASITLRLTGDYAALEQTLRILAASALTPTRVDLLSAAATDDLPGLALRFEGLAASVTEQTAQSIKIAMLQNLEVRRYEMLAETSFWQNIGAPPVTRSYLCKLGVLPAQAVQALRALAHLADAPFVVIHSASGLGRLWLKEDTAIATLQKIRDYCQTAGGFLTLLEAPSVVKQNFEVWGYTANALGLMQRLKQQFDPKNLLNPSRFVGDI